jgi:hypothetical protein
VAAFALNSLSYNGFNFDDTTQYVSSKVRAQPVYDDADRMVKLVDFGIDVKCTISVAGITTDNTMQMLRQVLTAPGKPLRYDSRGYGSFVINDPTDAGTVYDVAWGPKPAFFNYTQLGMGQGAMCEWRVSTRIPTCKGSVYSNAIMMSCYDVDYTIDDQGLTTISVSGAIEIPLTFGNGLNLTDNVDNYKAACFPAPPPRFKRMAGRKWRISKDRRRAEFSYTDQEMPVAYPTNVTRIDLKHTVKNAAPRWNNCVKWHNTVSGTIAAEPTVSKITTFDRFLRIVYGRMAQAPAVVGQGALGVGGAAAGVVNIANTVLGIFGIGAGQAAVSPPQAQAAAPTSGNSIFPQYVSITESIFDLDSQFSMSWDVVGLRGLTAAVQGTGLWTSVGTNDTQWQQSMNKNVNNARGSARMAYQNGDDVLIDLCAPSRSASVVVQDSQNSTVVPNVGVFDGNVVDAEVYEGSANSQSVSVLASLPPPILSSSLPPPQFSWMSYTTFYTYDQADNVAVQKPLAGAVTATPPQADPFAPNNAAVSQANSTTLPTGISATVPDVTQRLCAPSARVTLYGMAQRLGYAIQPPELSNIVLFQGQAVQELSKKVVPAVVGSVNGIPIYMTAWRIEYVVKSPPATLPTLVNPMFDYNNSQSSGQALLTGIK